VVERAENVELHFADGSSTAADVVIGADGIHSRVREQLVRDEPRYCGQSIYRALVPADRLAFLRTEPKVVLWLGPGKHCVCYPVASGEQISLAATVLDSQWSAESWSAQGQSWELAEAYLGWHPEVRAVTSSPNTISRWALHDREPLRQWSTDRITLVGDAAHPMLPFFAQGANQAIEDAVALAVCLQNIRRGVISQIAAALSRYEQARLPRTSEVHRISRANTVALHLPDGTEQRRRDNLLAVQARLADQEWIYGYDAEAAVAA
jgi:salicylate hydroxylase